jgi:ribosomal protein S18 acetylase RimI-like enzyme
VALKLYEEAGFRVIGTRKNYYKAPVEDACIMMRDLAVRGVDFDSVNGKK